MKENKHATKEAVEYEKGLKNLHELSLKKALSEEGIDTSKIPRKKLDDIRRLVDKRSPVIQKSQDVQQEANAIITKAQQAANAMTTKAQQDMQAELAKIQKEVEAIIKSIKIEQGLIKPPEVPQTQPEPVKEEIEPQEEKGQE